MRLEGVIEKRDALREHLAEVARGIGRRQPQPGVGFAGVRADLHAVAPGKPHHYHFRLYALSKKLGMKAGATKEELLRAIEGSVLGTSETLL